MGRRHTAGSAGNQGIGGVQVDNTTLSAADNQDITIDPSGTGIFKVAGDAQIQAQGDLRFADADSSNWIALQAPSTVAANVTFTLPAADGTNLQTLQTNGAGVLSFASTAVTVGDETVSSSTYYPTITTTTTGQLTGVNVTSTKFSFVPSTGALTVAGKVNSLAVENAQSSSYTFVASDAGGVVSMTNTSSATVTVPPNSSVPFPIGTVVDVYRSNTGAVTLQAGSGVTLRNLGTGIFASFEQLRCRKRGTNEWVVQHIPTAGAVSATGGSVTTSGIYTIHNMTGSTTFSIV